MRLSIKILSAFAAVAVLTLTSMTMEKSKKETGAYLEITLKVKEGNRMNAGGVYVKYKEPFLKQVQGATSKELLLRTEDVQVLHGFVSEADAKAYLTTEIFQNDVVGELKPYLESDPEVRIYSVFKN
ncbi:MAG: hypothetical protein ACJA08_002190 [Cyclobacteriaceae bacterium]|jgi:hypothetical protein